jgi:hypothetical protein
MNAWIAVENALVFSLNQYNFARPNNWTRVFTSGWRTAPAGYYRLGVGINNFKYFSSSSSVSDLSYSVEKPTGKVSGYAFLLHLMDEAVGKAEYMDDTNYCSPTKYGYRLQALLLLLLAILLQTS